MQQSSGAACVGATDMRRFTYVFGNGTCFRLFIFFRSAFSISHYDTVACDEGNIFVSLRQEVELLNLAFLKLDEWNCVLRV